MTNYEKLLKNRRELVNKIIENMNKGYVLPKEQWQHVTRPHNPTTNVYYRGGNRFRLMLAAQLNGYTDPRWMTYKQAEAAGYKIKPGSTGISCEKYVFEKEVTELDEKGRTIKKKEKLKSPIVNFFTVFNAEQVEGIAPLEVKTLEKNEVLKTAEDFIASSECPILELKQDRAYYSPIEDKIVLPERNLFRDQESFLGVALHEMAHSTAHPDRLNRPLMNFFGSPEYAMEELRAELASYFIESDLGIYLDDEHFNSHTHYLQSWIRVLENDPNELFRACADAERASARLIENYELYLKNEKHLVQDEEQVRNDKELRISPIKDVLKNGKVIDGYAMGNLTLFENAIKEFETANKIENPISEVAGEEEILKRYSEYVAISHQQELKEYARFFSNAQKEGFMNDSVNSYLAQIYFAKLNGLTDSKIQFLITQTNEKLLHPGELSEVRRFLEAGFTMEEAEKLPGKDTMVQQLINDEIRMDRLSEQQRSIILESSNEEHVFVCNDLFYEARQAGTPEQFDEAARNIISVTKDIEKKGFYTKYIPYKLKDYVLNEFKLSGPDVKSVGEEMLKRGQVMSNEEIEQFLKEQELAEGLTPLQEMNLLEIDVFGEESSLHM